MLQQLAQPKIEAKIHHDFVKDVYSPRLYSILSHYSAALHHISEIFLRAM